MFAELVFPLPFRNAFTYSIPKELAPLAQTGVRAAAPFGKRVLTGFIIGVKDSNEIKEKIKPLSDILDSKPIFNSNQLKFYEWLSDYYLCSLGEALRLAVPYGIEVESKRRIISDPDFCMQLLEKEKEKNSVKGKILHLLSEKNEVGFSYLQKAAGRKNIYSLIKTLEKNGAVTILDEIADPKVKAKKAKFVKIAKPAGEIYEYIPEIENRSPVQVKILLELISKRQKSIRLADLLKKTEASKTSIDSLEKKGLITITEKEIDRKFEDSYSEQNVQLVLTGQQKTIKENVLQFIKEKKFQTFLLHGVTGSGKTQVYIELAKQAIEENKSVLILVPEISLTPQMTSRLRNNFGDLVTVLHSRMSLGERYDAWRRILKNKKSVVIGPRSALFAPVDNPGLIVVDEEHDSSYKQNDIQPRYNGRDAAIMLARFMKCPVVLGSATPSIESMFNALNGKYNLLKLPERVDNAKLPVIKLVNITIEKKKKQMENIFSVTLLNKIQDRLTKKEGVIILQNRRGFSTQLYCGDCGELKSCSNCSVPMVFHINQNIIQCHYCGYQEKVPDNCPICGSINLKFFGTGTERVEDELAYYFPGAAIKRIDSDSVSKKHSLGKILQEFSQGEIDILVGTQMVSKGLDFSRVTLVGVISAETSLWLPDFRADERTFQLLTQVAGRSGRSKVEGEVIIQTQNEKNFTLQRVLCNDYKGFYEKEIFSREKMGYPPFTRLCLIELKDMDEQKVKNSAHDFYQGLLAYRKWLKITPPSMAMIYRLKGFYRYHLLIKSFKETDPGGAILRKAVLTTFIEFNRKSRYRDVKLLFDIDPQSVI